MRLSCRSDLFGSVVTIGCPEATLLPLVIPFVKNALLGLVVENPLGPHIKAEYLRGVRWGRSGLATGESPQKPQGKQRHDVESNVHTRGGMPRWSLTREIEMLVMGEFASHVIEDNRRGKDRRDWRWGRTVGWEGCPCYDLLSLSDTSFVLRARYRQCRARCSASLNLNS
jgi:hypothetical protein